VKIDQAFDRWEEGDDACDIEAVILVDRSGSMSSGQNDKKASIACWTIKRALEHIQAPVTVYAFDDQAEVAYTRTEVAHKTEYKFIYGNGGTEPYPALLAAEQLLMSSRKKNKMLFVVTDGVFNTNKNDELIERISRRGILTAMTLIMNDKEWKYYVEDHQQLKEEELRHKAEVFGRISNAQDLLPFARQVVTSAIRKRSRLR
jgi:predicted metal-dependent peptidase